MKDAHFLECAQYKRNGRNEDQIPYLVALFFLTTIASLRKHVPWIFKSVLWNHKSLDMGHHSRKKS